MIKGFSTNMDIFLRAMLLEIWVAPVQYPTLTFNREKTRAMRNDKWQLQ